MPGGVGLPVAASCGAGRTHNERRGGRSAPAQLGETFGHLRGSTCGGASPSSLYRCAWKR